MNSLLLMHRKWWKYLQFCQLVFRRNNVLQAISRIHFTTIQISFQLFAKLISNLMNKISVLDVNIMMYVLLYSKW